MYELKCQLKLLLKQNKVISMRYGIIIILCLGLIFLTSNAFAISTSEKISKGVSYLQSVQNEDGGFPSSQGRESSAMVTDWVMMALCAVGEDTAGEGWNKKGITPALYLSQHFSGQESTTDYARTLLALTTAPKGTVEQGLALEKKVAEKIMSWQLPQGQFAQQELGEDALLSPQIWSVLALKAAEREIPNQDTVLDWLVSQQNRDGGFSWVIGGESDPDDTGVALSALAALGVNKDDLVVQKAVKYLKEQQNEDGGFSWTDQKTNTATDSWVIQGLTAVGEDSMGNNWRINGKSPLDHLCSLQNSDGSFQWISGQNSSPVLMTAYALLALSGASLPVNLSESGEFSAVIINEDGSSVPSPVQQNDPEENKNLAKLSGDICRFLKNSLLSVPKFLWL